MKLFYYCFARAHSSVVAGNIHLNRLPVDRVPSIEEIMAIGEFDKSDPADWGVPYYLGQDEFDNEVYLVGFGKDRKLGLQTVYNVISQYDNPLEWRFFDTLPEINLLTKIGGYLSRNWHWVRVGRYLAALGIQRCYPNLVNLVQQIKRWCTVGQA